MTVVDAFQAATEKLAAETERLVLDVYAAWKAGRYSQPEAELAIAGIINRANASAVTLADVYLAAQIEDALGAATPAVGVAPVDDAQRLAKAVRAARSAS